MADAPRTLGQYLDALRPSFADPDTRHFDTDAVREQQAVTGRSVLHDAMSRASDAPVRADLFSGDGPFSGLGAEGQRFLGGVLAGRNDEIRAREQSAAQTRTTERQRRRGGWSRGMRPSFYGLDNFSAGRRTRVDRYYEDANHPGERRGTQLESVRDSYAREMGDRPWSHHANILFFGTHESPENKATAPLSPLRQFIQPELSTMRDWKLTPKNPEDLDAIQRLNGTPSNKTTWTLGELLGRDSNLQLPDRRSLSSNGRPTVDRKGVARFFTRGARKGEPITGGTSPLEAVTAGQLAAHTIMEQAQLRLEQHPAFNTPLHVSEKCTSCGNVRDFKPERDAECTAVDSEGAQCSGTDHRTFINYKHPKNEELLKRQRATVKNVLGSAQEAINQLMHGNGYVQDPISGRALTVRTDHGLPQRHHRDQAVLGRDGNFYYASQVAMEKPRDSDLTAKVFHPGRAQFDSEGRVTNPEEARLTEDEQNKAIVKGGSYKKPLHISSIFRNFSKNLLDSDNGFKVVQGGSDEDNEAFTKSLRGALNSVIVHSGHRPLEENITKPLNLVTDSSYSRHLKDVVSKEDPILFKALDRHIPNLLSPPGSGPQIDEETVDQVVPKILERQQGRKKSSLVDAAREHINQMVAPLKSRRNKANVMLPLTQNILSSMGYKPSQVHIPGLEPVKLTEEQRRLLSGQVQSASTLGKIHYLDQASTELGQMDWKGSGVSDLRRDSDLLQQNVDRLNTVLGSSIPVDWDEELKKASGNPEALEKVNAEQKKHGALFENYFGILKNEPYMPDEYRSFGGNVGASEKAKITPTGLFGQNPTVESPAVEKTPRNRKTPLNSGNSTEEIEGERPSE